MLNRWQGANGRGSLSLSSGAAAAAVPATGAGAGAAADSGSGTGSGSAGHRKSVQTAAAAIRGEHPDTSGEVYGLVGTSASVDGAGVAAANLDGGPDLVLDGITNGETDTELSEAGIDRASPNQETFTLHNSGPGRIDFEVVGDVYADTIDIEEIKIAGSTLVDETGEWMGLGSTVPCDSCVGSSDITDGQVGAADLAPGAVTDTRLRDDAVTSAKILDGTITRHDLGADSVGATAIADGSVIGDDIADGTVTYRDLAADSVRGSHIRNGDVTAADLADGSVGTIKIVTGSVTMAKLAHESVGTNQIEYGGVERDDIGSNAVGTDQLATGGVESSDIMDGTITAQDVSPTGGVYSSKSAVYVVTDTTHLPAWACQYANPSCDDANDLPLFAAFDPGDDIPTYSIERQEIAGWDSLSYPAAYLVEVCEQTGSAGEISAFMACVSVPGS